MFGSRCIKSQCFTVSVPIYAEGCSSVATQNELNHFVLSIVTNSNFVFVLFTCIAFFFLIKCGCSGLEVISIFIRFMEAVRVSECLGCNGLLEFLLGCSGLSRLSLFEGNLLRLMT